MYFFLLGILQELFLSFCTGIAFENPPGAPFRNSTKIPRNSIWEFFRSFFRSSFWELSRSSFWDFSVLFSEDAPTVFSGNPPGMPFVNSSAASSGNLPERGLGAFLLFLTEISQELFLRILQIFLSRVLRIIQKFFWESYRWSGKSRNPQAVPCGNPPGLFVRIPSPVSSGNPPDLRYVPSEIPSGVLE